MIRRVCRVLVLVIGLCAAAALAEQPRYVFLFIGDGMGPAQRQTAEAAAQAVHGEGLLMENFPVKGQIQTRSADAKVTDSAAAATALAAGVKTNNGMIGQLPDGSNVPSISDRLADAGFKVGVISSVQANHATPAAFYAHVPKRSMYNEIASQFPASRVELLIGNGLNSPDRQQDAIQQAWRDSGIATIGNLSETVPAGARVAAILRYPPASTEKQTPGPGQLAESVAYAIRRLDNEQGFFIMVEGGRVDWESHANKAGEAIDEVFALDRAIRVADEFRRQRPDQTLIVVTADHETGGMTLNRDRLDVRRLMDLTGKQDDVTKAINELPELTVAAVQALVAERLDLRDLSEDELAQITKAIEEQQKKAQEQVGKTVMKIAQARAGITWTTGGHTGVDVPVTAIGAGAEAFAGSFDNTQIPLKIMNLMLAQPAAAAK